MATIAITTQRGRLGSVSETSPQGEDGHVPAGIADGRPQSPDTPTAIPLQEQQSAKQPSAPPYLKPTQQTPRAIASTLQRIQHNSSGRGDGDGGGGAPPPGVAAPRDVIGLAARRQRRRRRREGDARGAATADRRAGRRRRRWRRRGRAAALAPHYQLGDCEDTPLWLHARQLPSLDSKNDNDIRARGSVDVQDLDAEARAAVRERTIPHGRFPAPPSATTPRTAAPRQQRDATARRHKLNSVPRLATSLSRRLRQPNSPHVEWRAFSAVRPAPPPTPLPNGQPPSPRASPCGCCGPLSPLSTRPTRFSPCDRVARCPCPRRTPATTDDAPASPTAVHLADILAVARGRRRRSQ